MCTCVQRPEADAGCHLLRKTTAEGNVFVLLQLLYSPYLLFSVFSSSHLSSVSKTHNSKSGLLLVAPEVLSEGKCLLVTNNGYSMYGVGVRFPLSLSQMREMYLFLTQMPSLVHYGYGC